MLNLRDVYDEGELKSHNPNLRFLQEVDKRTGYRTKQMLVAPVAEPGSSETRRRGPAYQQQSRPCRSDSLPRRGWRSSARRWPSRLKQRQKPQGLQDKVRIFW